MSSVIHKFNNDSKSWKIHAYNLQSISGDHLNLSASNNKNIYLNVSGGLVNTTYLDVSNNLRVYGNAVFANNLLTDNSSVKIPNTYNNYAFADHNNLLTNLTKTGNTWIDLSGSGYKVDYSPLSNNSKVFLHGKISYIASAESEQFISFQLLRLINGNETILFSDMSFGSVFGTLQNGIYSFDYVDTPSSSDNITYYLKYQISDTGNNVDVSSGVLGYDNNNINCLMAQELYIPSMDGIIQTVNTSLENVFQDNRDASFNNVDVSGSLKIDGSSVIIIPSQTNNNGKYLTTNGSNLSWETVTIGSDISLTNYSDALFGNVDISGDLDISGNFNCVNTSTSYTSNSTIANISTLNITGVSNLLNNQIKFESGNSTFNNNNIVLSGNSSITSLDGTIDISGTLNSTNSNNTLNYSSHLIPTTNDTFDIGSAEYKVRDLYVSNNSIFIGDVNKLDVDTNGSLVLRKRKTNIVPSGLFEDLDNSELGFNKTDVNDIINDINLKLELTTPIIEFSQMKLENWKSYSDKIRTNNNKTKKEINELFKPTESNDWEEEKNLNSLISNYNNAYFNNITVSGNIIPVNDNEISLGSSDKSFKDIYIGPGSLYINGKKVIEDDSTSMVFKTDNDEDLTIQTTGNSGLLKFRSGYNITLDPSGSIDLISNNLNFKDNITLDTISNNGAINIDCKVNVNSDLYLQSNNINSYLYTGTNFTIDPHAHGDNTGKLILKGDLEVQGSTTTINSTTLDINDNRIKLNATESTDAGIDISFNDGTSKSFYYDKTNSKWKTDNTSLDIGTGNLNTGQTTVTSLNANSGTIQTTGNMSCEKIKVSNQDTIGTITASVNGTTLDIDGDSNSSYSVLSLTGTVSSIDTFTHNNNILKNSQILIYYTNNSGGDLTINNSISGCKTNLNEALTISNGEYCLFCLIRISDTYILTVSQLY